MSDAPSGGLLDLAQRVAGAARAGEEVEAYVVRSRETEVRVFDGDVESLSMAGVEGVGVRVISDHRQGFAWAGSLETAVVDETLDEARDNAAFGEPDEWNGLPSPSDFETVTTATLDVWRESLLAVPPDDKVTLAIELERATRAADPRVRGVESAGYGDTAVEAAVASSLGVAATSRRTMCSCSSFSIAGDADDTQTGYGFSVGRAFDELDPADAARTAAERAVRLLGATKPRTQRLPVVLDPLVTRSLLAILGSALGGESVLKNRSMFVGRDGEQVAAPKVTLRDDPTHSAPPATTPRASRPGPSTSSPAACCSGTSTTPTPAAGPARPRRDRPCGVASSRRPASAPVHCTSSPARSGPTRSSRPCRRPCTSSP